MMIGDGIRLRMCPLVCVVLKLMHDSFYLIIETNDGYIDDIIVENRVNYNVGYAYVPIE